MFQTALNLDSPGDPYGGVPLGVEAIVPFLLPNSSPSSREPIMKRLILALSLAAAALLALAGCQLQEPTVRGTVVAVTEVPVEGLEESARHYEHPLVPEVAWQVQVQLDDGRAVTVTPSGDRRYQAGERVRLLVDAERALLL
jgi:hypothetical protein